MAKKRGNGKTTRSPTGLVKKTFWFQPDEAQRLRKEAFERETSQAELVREAVRLFFGMPPKEEEAADENLHTDRQELERLLQSFSRSPEQAADILSTLDDPDGDDEGKGDDS